LQAIQIHSSIRGKLYIELAKLTKNNASICIQNCIESFRYINPEDVDQITIVVKFLTNSYRRLGQRDDVKNWYAIWKMLKTNQSKNIYYTITNTFSTDPEICIRWGQYTIDHYQNELSLKEKEQLYVLLVDSYKGLRDQKMIDYWLTNLRTIRGAN